MAKVELRNVTKRFPDGTVAVDRVNVTCEDREFLVLVGPSGCGKSTTLRMVAGLEEASEGQILIDGRDVTRLPPGDRNIAMVFQNYALYPHMSVFENIAYAMTIEGRSKEEIRRLVLEAAALLHIEPLLSRRPGELSGGQRQRVALGRAIVRKPKVFLFDEPLSNLDAKMRLGMRAEIARLRLKLGATMIYVTHDQAEAMTLADRIVIMKSGVIQQVDAPLRLYERPCNLFVADFIGSPGMNFFRGAMARRSGALQFRVGDTWLSVPEASRPYLERLADRELVLGLRSEHIAVSSKASNAPPDSMLSACVERVELLGDEAHVHFDAGGLGFVARMDAHENPSPGQEYELFFDLERGHFFDPGQGERLASGVSLKDLGLERTEMEAAL